MGGWGAVLLTRPLPARTLAALTIPSSVAPALEARPILTLRALPGISCICACDSSPFSGMCPAQTVLKMPTVTTTVTESGPSGTTTTTTTTTTVAEVSPALLPPGPLALKFETHDHSACPRPPSRESPTGRRPLLNIPRTVAAASLPQHEKGLPAAVQCTSN